MKSILGVALGGAAGALLRWGSALVAERVGISAGATTFVVNVVGCFAYGYLAAGGAGGIARNGTGVDVWLVGLLGGFTTFSAFAGIVSQGMVDGAFVRATAYAMAQVAAGAVAVVLGAKLAP